MECDGSIDANGVRWCVRTLSVQPVDHLDSFLEWLREQPKTIKPDPKLKRYFLTFTHDTVIGNKSVWFKRLCTVLQSKMFKTISVCIEHIDTNIHCHADVTTTTNISRDKFVSFLKGCRRPEKALDIRKIGKDNGVKSYLTKESKEFSDYDAFFNHYNSLIPT